MALYKQYFAVEIDLTDHTTDSDSSVGLVSGYFRWVSGRPSYDGATTIPTGDNDGDVWYNGFFLYKNSFGAPDRIIDITLGGDYSSLSGFEFKRINDDKFQVYLETNSYFIINRPIKFYHVIDDEFIQIWTGVISKTEYNELAFNFSCANTFLNAHKKMPANLVTKNTFPNTESSQIGKTIPIVFGDVLYCPVLNVGGKEVRQQLGFNSNTNTEIYVSKAVDANFDGPVSGMLVLTLKTPNIVISENRFAETDHWIRVIKGTEQSIFIHGNAETTGTGNDATTDVYITSFLEGVTDLAELQDNIAGLNEYEDIWWYEIIEMEKTNLISENEIYAIPQDSKGRYYLKQYNEENKVYDDISHLVSYAGLTSADPIGHPFVKLFQNKITQDGTFTRFIPVSPEKLEYVSVSSSIVDTNEFLGGDINLLLDRSRATSLSLISTSGPNYITQLKFKAKFPDSLTKDGMDKIFLLPDLDIDMGVSTTAVLIITLTPIDVYGEEQESIIYSGSKYHPENMPSGAVTNYNFLPNEYYRGGNNNSELSFFGRTINGGSGDHYINDKFEIPSEMIDNVNKTTAISEVMITISVENFLDGEINSVSIKQIGFYARQKINVKSEDQYLKVSGEKSGVYQTNSVHRAIRHILEDLDGISSFDLSNLPTTRGLWPVGTVITEQKNSNEYLKELCSQSFVAMFTDRYGNRKAISFMDLDTLEFTHSDTNGTILANKIKSFKSTDPEDIYNEFELKFDYDPGTKTYNRVLSISKVAEEETFPGVDESEGTDTPQSFIGVGVLTTYWKGGPTAIIDIGSPPTWCALGDKITFHGPNINFTFADVVEIYGNLIVVVFNNIYGTSLGATDSTGTLTHHSNYYKSWTRFVGGINDYTKAAYLWQVCKESHIRTNTLNKLTLELKWFHDPGMFEGIGESDNTSAHFLLDLLIEWATREKDVATYSIPITPDNLKLELMSYGRFRDTIHTDNVYKNGYITKIKVLESEIELEVTLIPDSVPSLSTADIYVETTNNINNIVESTAGADQIEEGV